MCRCSGAASLLMFLYLAMRGRTSSLSKDASSPPLYQLPHKPVVEPHNVLCTPIKIGPLECCTLAVLLHVRGSVVCPRSEGPRLMH